MPLTRIESIQEYRNWLIVRGGEPTQQITIPVEVEGFQELKRKLATYGTVSPLKTKSSPLWLLQLAVATVAYVLLLTSHVVSVVIVAGCLALIAGAGILLVTTGVPRKTNEIAFNGDVPFQLSDNRMACL